MNKLLFFNKDGYPHNFQYDEQSQSWYGKIIFDENSDQTFRTQSFHIFESVDAVDFSFNANLISMSYNNSSGMTFYEETNFKNESITNILKVNDSDIFHSKWIFGNNFHEKFPIGSCVHFSNVTGNNEIGKYDYNDNNYFTVISSKRNAILIITETSNYGYDFQFISGKISSISMISIKDYNRDLKNDTLFKNLNENKKISIINSENNDGVVSIKKSGVTFSYVNDIKLDGEENDTFHIEIDLLTERIKIFEGDIKIINSNTLYVGKYAYLLEPVTVKENGEDKIIHKEIIFENIVGDKLFDNSNFKITSVIKTKEIGDKILNIKKYYDDTTQYKTNNQISNSVEWNTISFDGITTLKSGDIIKLTKVDQTGLDLVTTYSTSRISGETASVVSFDNTIMHNRELSIKNVLYNDILGITTLFVTGYVIDNIAKYKITQLLKNNQSEFVKFETGSNITDFINITYNKALCYSVNNKMKLSQTYLIENDNNSYSNTINSFINKHRYDLLRNGIDCFYSKINNVDYLSIEGLHGTSMPYFTCSAYTNNNKIKNEFINSDNGFTENYNIITNEKIYNEQYNRISEKLYKDIINTKILLDIKKGDTNFGFKLKLNGNEYDTIYKNNTNETIDSFVETWGDILYKNGFIIDKGYDIETSNHYLQISSDIDIWDLKVIVNMFSTYKIIENKRNEYLLLSANEIINNENSSLFDLEIATGSILKLSNSRYDINNKEYNIIGLSNNKIELSYQGLFYDDFNVNITCHIREYLRKPRGSYFNDIYLRVFWEKPYDEIEDKTIFLYDISGEQLNYIKSVKEIKYIGKKPLIDSNDKNIIFLNTKPNEDISKASNPKYQQTLFDELLFKLDDMNSQSSFDWIPEPLEIFMGYNSADEGVNSRLLKIQKIEKYKRTNDLIVFSGYTNSGSSMTINNFILEDDTIKYKAQVDFNFMNIGFKKDQLIKIYFKDQKETNQTIFENVNTYKISKVNRSSIIINTGYTYDENDITINSSGFTYFKTNDSTFYFLIEVLPQDILSCVLYGQTENEDIRFKVNLNNLGVRLEDDDYKIFSEVDIQDNCIDYTILNKKRKELLSVNREIFDYVGSYKALINSINFFGYNDLLLYEYYKEIDKNKSKLKKIHKVLIPDIFDMNVIGWHESDFISEKFKNNVNWKKTNLFNLAFNITDDDGNNSFNYSLEDKQFKLAKLRNWLRKNVIPMSSNLLDITGVSNTNTNLYQEYDESNQTVKYVVERNTTIVNFNYTATLNFGTDYLITVNFYVNSGSSNNTTEIPESFSAKIKTFYLSGNTFNDPTNILIPVQYFKINKNDLKPFSFNLNKNVDPYIYIETTTYDNSGNGIGYVNNKMFYYDEPRNHWIVNNNFDLTKMKYYQTKDFVENKYETNLIQL